MAAHLTNSSTNQTSTPEVMAEGSPKTAFVTGVFDGAVVYAETLRPTGTDFVVVAEFNSPESRKFDFTGRLRFRQALSAAGTSITVSTE